MKKSNYSYYTTEELLQDDYFINSIRHPTTESNAYWNALIEEGKIKKEDYELSRFFILLVQPDKEQLSKNESSDMWMKIEERNKKRLQTKIRRLYLLSTAAAIFILLGGISFMFYPMGQPEKSSEGIQIATIKKPDMKGDDIRILLSDQNQIVLKEIEPEVNYSAQGEIKVNTQTIEQASVKPKGIENPIYNELITPKGRRSVLTLSDGSKLWINAGSYVMYPVVFTGKNREIYVDGEIYVEVAHDKAHPFIIKTENLDVRVTGTAFNLNAYKENSEQAIVLVSGAVNIKTKENSETTLAPNQLFSYSEKGSRIQVVDVENYVLWKDGLYQYKSENLGSILKRLALFYGEQIEYDEAVALIKCSGKLDLKEELGKVLKGLASSASVQYKKENNIHYIRSIHKKDSL